MSFEYAAYVAFVFCGALALSRFFGVRLQAARVLSVLIPVMALFFLWDSFAAARGWWSFGFTHMLGFFVGNQPVEEVLFFAAIPLFYIVSWESLKTHEARGRPSP